MPYLETLDELVEDLADKLGAYNSGPENDIHSEDCKCRICFVIGMKERILTAVENTEFLSKSQIDLMRNVRLRSVKEISEDSEGVSI